GHSGERVQKQKTHERPQQGAPASASHGANRREVDRLLDMNLAALFTLDHTGVFQIDQIFLLQRAQLVQHLIGRVNSVKIEDDQSTHVLSPAMDRFDARRATPRKAERMTSRCGNAAKVCYWT